jgi:hypothetical protein
MMLVIAILVVSNIWAYSNYNNLNSEYSRLKADYELLKTNYSNLNLKYSSLKNDYDVLSLKYYNLSSKYNTLNLEYLELEANYSSLKADYELLKTNYDNLQSAIKRGEALAKSATWISEDKRLEVISEVIPKFFLGELWDYTIRVTITNIGNETLNEVHIFLFPYQGDKLVEYWSPDSYYKYIGPLIVGKSYSYDFNYVPKEMTSYKVLVLAGL